MFSALLEFNTIPKIGFAHHFYTDDYCFSYNKPEKSFEIVYIKSGGIEAELYGQKQYIPEKSIFVLFRHLPVTLRAVNNEPQSHCTVQAELDCRFALGADDITSENALLIPLVVQPCAETENIKKDLFSIISDIGISRTENGFSSSLKLLDIMRRLDKIARKSNAKNKSPASIIIYRVKKFVAKNIENPITLSDIGDALDLSPGYIDHVFKSGAGMPIKQYINSEKAKRIAELIQKQQLSFKTACANVGINDPSYGYRLFKKHTGVTPGEFLAGGLHK